MRRIGLALALSITACGGSQGDRFTDTDAAGGTNENNGRFGGDGGGPTDGALPDGGATTVTTVYANTDDTLYALDPTSKAVTSVGKFSGIGGGSLDNNVTDCAVDSAGDVYVISESVLYKATLPAGGSGTVNLTKVTALSTKSGQRFYALAFAPAGVLGAGEGLVAGDGAGVLWSVDPQTGATSELGSFGKDGSSRVFALSGDIVFYLDGSGKPTGLATIRSCSPGGTSCTTTNDYLAGIDMTALSTAFTSGTPAGSLLAGIYGGSASGKGPGIGFGDVFGLAAWQGDVFGFTRGSGTKPAKLLSIDTTSGAGAPVPGAASVTNGWSGAGVTTKVTITVPPPPPPPA
jgi:hypothetical protein